MPQFQWGKIPTLIQITFYACWSDFKKQINQNQKAESDDVGRRRCVIIDESEERTKMHGFTTGGLYSPLEPCEARFITDACTLFHVSWTVDKKHPLTPL